MNSNDQDFVKSFSRRIRLSDLATASVEPAKANRPKDIAAQIANENAVSGEGGATLVSNQPPPQPAQPTRHAQTTQPAEPTQADPSVLPTQPELPTSSVPATPPVQSTRLAQAARPTPRPPSKSISRESSATWWIDDSTDHQYRVDHVQEQTTSKLKVSQPKVSQPKQEVGDIRLANFRDELVTEPIDSQYVVGLSSDQALAALLTQHDTSERVDKPHVKFSVQPLKRKSKSLAPQPTVAVPDSSTLQSVSEEQMLSESAALIQEVANQVTDATSSERINVEVETRSETEARPETQTDAEQSPAVLVFKPAWEVDQFALPSNVAKLFFSGKVFQQIAEQMLSAVETGLASVLITSVNGEEGRSTVAMGIAMAAAAANIRVALVDADLVKPTLVDDLSLDIESDWLASIRHQKDLSAVAVHGIEDGVTFFPLLPSEQGQEATFDEIQTLIQTLKQNFDLVVIDGSISDLPATDWCAAAVESVMIVRDVGHTGEADVKRLSDRLMRAGVKGIGVVENFT